MAEDEDRYAYLLNPIKDLQKNWDINLEEILSCYLADLSEIADAEEQQGRNNKHSVDFAQASKVIQGTSSVYFKKVDYVYTDVISFRDMLSSQKGKKNKKGANGDNGDEDDGGADPVDAVPADSFVLIDYAKSKRSDMVSLCLKSGPKRVLTVPLMPMSLMPLADYEKCNVPMYARKKSKEVIGKKDDFKMNTAYISEEGAILLDLLNRNLIGKFSRKTDKENMAPEAHLIRFSQVSRPATQTTLSSQPIPPSQQLGSQSFVSYGTNEADDEVGAMMGRRTDSLLPMEDQREGSMSRGCISTLDERRKTEQLRPSTRFNMSIVNEDQEDDFGDGGGFDISMGEGMGEMNGDKENVARRVRRKIEEWEVQEDEDDPLFPLFADEFDVLKWHRCPAVRANTRLNTKKMLAVRVKGAKNMDKKEKAMETLKYLNEYVHKKTTRRKKGEEENWSLSVLSKFASKVKKHRECEKRKKKIELRKQTQSQSVDGEEEYEMDNGDDYYEGGAGFDDDGVHDGMNDLPMASSSPKKRGTALWVEEDGGMGEGMEMDTDTSDDMPGMGEDEDGHGAFAHLGFDDFRVAGMGNVYDTISGVNELFWEDEETELNRIRASRARGRGEGEEDEKKKETMNMRIQDWSNRVIPLLEEEEEFKEFDIHHYGNTMLEAFDEVGEEKILPQMVDGCHQREVSRYMLALLMMANTYNVKVTYADNASVVVPMEVSLLKKERHHEVFDNKEGFL